MSSYHHHQQRKLSQILLLYISVGVISFLSSATTISILAISHDDDIQPSLSSVEQQRVIERNHSNSKQQQWSRRLRRMSTRRSWRRGTAFGDQLVVTSGDWMPPMSRRREICCHRHIQSRSLFHCHGIPKDCSVLLLLLLLLMRRKGYRQRQQQIITNH